MINIFNRVKNIILLVLGAILFIGGIGGLIFFRPWEFTNQTSAQSTTEIFVAPTPLIQETQVINSTDSNTSGQINTETLTSVAYNYPILDPKEYYVHAPEKSGLENPMIPDRIQIPSVGIDVIVVIAGFTKTDVDGETFGQWEAPNEDAAGWHPNTAVLGQIGNTVINGHHNEYGKAFAKLVDVKVGDLIYAYSQGHKFTYIVANRMILLERFVDTATRLQNARWLGLSDDERLTLVTCWPKFSNTHRLIIVARPYHEQDALTLPDQSQ
jgi:LPXTG-site transpeptidase (sortase) family protein